MDFDLFVIGGGSAGVRTGRIAAGHGARVGIAEARFWGGTCVNVGCVPKKLMVQASEYGAFAEDARGFGWHGRRPEHDWAALIAAKDREVRRLSGLYRQVLEAAGARVFEARARFLDPHTLMVGEARVTAERIVIATGGHPVVPPIPGRALAVVSDDVFHLPAMPRRVAIIGSGYIAVEFAGIFAGLGAETHLVYRQPVPLRGFDADLREALAEALAADGIALHPGTHPARIEAAGDARTLHLDDGRAITADLVFFATGRAPNIAGLGLEAAHVITGPNGEIIVDSGWATSQPHIYAIGDVTGRFQLTPVATAEGHALADALFGPRPREYNFTSIPTAVFSSPPLATVGLTEAEAAARGPAEIYLTRFTPMRHTLSGRKRRTVMKLVVEPPRGRVLGAHMLGEDAPEIMQGIAVAMTAGATKADFDRTIGIHPTSAEEFVTLRTLTRTVGLPQAAE
ncbi:MAG TPA: glutathione-disulfide reductase [Acetobacteraceae bacterium]|jgi:glutathione reductase (NADPH)|nr:glutathione-disulfide reductase [Acetobacteraceae bacterium]